ncbi:MAG: S-layer homology domain-containing protein [Oscillospiraceae bacterium]|nr:S-layer homology domain-containing protein [Oscillospiraceae bacterium]
MKRILWVCLLLCSLLLGLMQPVLATEIEEIPTAETLAKESAETIDSQQPEEQEDIPTETESVPEATRSGSTYTTSAAGLAFISEMMGSYGSSQLAGAEKAINNFITNNGLNLSQKQFDALVDFCMEYGSNMFTSGYQCERVIVSGNYTDAQLASAFCSWVKDGSGNFSQSKLNRRLRQIKLFLYGSYDGVCQANFRYVIYNGNGGSLNDNTVLCYTYGGTYANLPTAKRSGYYFGGWYTAASGGSHLCNSDSVTDNRTVYARWSSTEVTNPNESGSSGSTGENGWPELPKLKISEEGIQFIKDHEGFVAYPMWDYAQYTIGYGTRYDPDNSPIPISIPITEEEADYLLRHMLAGFESVLDKQLAKGSVTHTQAQYDAMMSFTFNLGQQWINSQYKIYNYFLYGGYTELEFVNTIGSWCRAGGSVLTGLARRRMDEANLYLNGDYTLNSKVYLCILFNGAKGEPDVGFRYYKTGAALGYLPGATREGYRLTGWYDKVSGGTKYTTATIAASGGILNLYAQWEVGQPEETPPSPPIEVPPGVFIDVPADAWFYEPVMLAVEAGIFGGMSATEFMPNAAMSRAMLVTVLHRIAGVPKAGTAAPFTDVPSGQWYSDAVDWAYEKGIVNGVSETAFGLNDNITREQLTTMLYRYAQYCGYSTDQHGDLTVFPDAGSVQSYAQEAMEWAVGCGIVSGDNGKLNPANSATRAQCAKMIMVFLNTHMR